MLVVLERNFREFENSRRYRVIVLIEAQVGLRMHANSSGSMERGVFYRERDHPSSFEIRMVLTCSARSGFSAERKFYRDIRRSVEKDKATFKGIHFVTVLECRTFKSFQSVNIGISRGGLHCVPRNGERIRIADLVPSWLECVSEEVFFGVLGCAGAFDFWVN